jgi:hypothetical protein
LTHGTLVAAESCSTRARSSSGPPITSTTSARGGDGLAQSRAQVAADQSAQQAGPLEQIKRFDLAAQAFQRAAALRRMRMMGVVECGNHQNPGAVHLV